MGSYATFTQYPSTKADVDIANVQDQEPKARAQEDILPPFSTLTTDDERERKAESRDPGTFVVVANLTSFADLPEYRDESLGSLRRGSANSEYDGDISGQNSLSGSVAEESDDPNVSLVHTTDVTGASRSNFQWHCADQLGFILYLIND